MTTYEPTEADVQAGGNALINLRPYSSRRSEEYRAHAVLAAVVPGIVQRAKAEAWEEGAIWAVSQDWMAPQKRSDGTIVVNSRPTSEPQPGNPYHIEAGEQDG